MAGKHYSLVAGFIMVFAFTALVMPLSQAEAALDRDPGEEGSQWEQGELPTEIEERIQDRKEQLEEFRQSPELTQERLALPLEEKVFVRGEPVDFQPYGQPPVIENNRTLVPIRTINDYLGAETDWDGELNQVTIQHAGITIEIIIDETEVRVNGEPFQIDVPAALTGNNRTVVPLRFISEVMGVSVDYCEELHEIDLGLDPDAEPELPWAAAELGPAEVVEEFWALQRQGKIQEAVALLTDEAAHGLEGIVAGLDDELEAVEAAFMERFQVEALSHEVENDTARVQIEITKPNLEELMDETSERSMDRAAALAEEGFSDEEIQEIIEEEYDDIMLAALQETGSVSYQEEVVLELVEGDWKISDWLFEQMTTRWEEL